MKKFIPNSISIWFMRIMYFSFASLCLIFGIIGYVDKLLSLLLLIVFLVGSVIFICETIVYFSYNIKILDNEIYTKGEFRLFKSERIQYKTLINYADIEDIKIISSNHDSRNQVLHINLIASPISKFLEFKTKSGKLKRIWINFFTKKQIERLLNVLIDRIKSVNPETQLSVEKIMEDWYAYPKNAKNIKN